MIDEKRVQEYKKAREMLDRHGGHMMNYIGLQKQFADVVTWLETSASPPEPAHDTSDSHRFASG